jgi:hypothetical protein
MTIRRWLLGTYRLLLRLYPPAFRTRFAGEMLELAAAADADEWPLIFGDTCVAILRCWFTGNGSTVVAAGPDAYLSLGESPLRGARLLQGFVLSIAFIVGLYCLNYTRTPPKNQCPVLPTDTASR